MASDSAARETTLLPESVDLPQSDEDEHQPPTGEAADNLSVAVLGMGNAGLETYDSLVPAMYENQMGNGMAHLVMPNRQMGFSQAAPARAQAPSAAAPAVPNTHF